MFFKNIAYDVNAVLERDPAARSKVEVFLLYPGIQAVLWQERNLLHRGTWHKTPLPQEEHPCARAQNALF